MKTVETYNKAIRYKIKWYRTQIDYTDVLYKNGNITRDQWLFRGKRDAEAITALQSLLNDRLHSMFIGR